MSGVTPAEAACAAQNILLPAYLLALAALDIRTKRLPAALLFAGGGTGILLRILDLAAGKDAAALCRSYLPGLAAGAFLLAAAALTREAVGYGDGICFCTLAFWLPWGSLITLLMTALFLCAVPGAVIGLIRRRRKIALPFLPFAAGAYLLLALLGAIGEVSP